MMSMLQYWYLSECWIHSCPSLCGSDAMAFFAAVTRRAHMMGAARVPGVGVGVWVAHGAVAVSQCVQLVVVKADRGRRQ